MPHDITLISTIAVGFALAFICGFLAHRVGASPLVGYLVAGVAIGPFTPGFVADRALARQLAEIGVMLLMFGVGLHFSVADLMAVRRVVLLKLGAGEVFGEMALSSGQPRSADVPALDYSTFAILSGRDFRQLLRKYPEIRAQIARLAAQRAASDRQVLVDGLPPEAPRSS
jgi:hypothetical protein